MATSEQQPVSGGTGPRYALVTGVLGGIGTAIVDVLQEHGYTVIGIDRHDGETKADHYHAVDLADLHKHPEKTASAVAEIKKTLGGKLHLLVNNAAYQVVKPVDKLTTTDWDTTMTVNLSACFTLIQTFLDELKATKGSIVNVSSIHCNLTKPGFVAYATSKGALVSLTRALAVELGSFGITVNAILPAATATPMLVDGFKDNPEGYSMLEKFHPSGRIAEPREVAEFIAFVASDKCRFINGSALQIDGGIGGRLHDPVQCKKKLAHVLTSEL